MTIPTTQSTESKKSRAKKPQVAVALATWFGSGYLPKAPGTWGSLSGVAISWLFLFFWPRRTFLISTDPIYYVIAASLFVIAFGLLGVWASAQTEAWAGEKDPQYVVIDEVSGQMLALMVGAGMSKKFETGLWNGWALWLVMLLGFVLFRLFDIWKPFPIRAFEKLPSGWGIMADDWAAGAYAAIVIAVALHFRWL